ncbi:S-layer homology domain-containing protein [Paenibacillus yanchengensis]|uniref:S-layer homology domain-containing protein n=1 Tax=Paenibacillus yanchengensis TaxID=2035833 RepID=A0ABW4YNG7_9BACL
MNKKKMTSLLLSIMMVMSLFGATLASAETAEKTFSDLSSHWAKTEVEAWASQGLVEGYADGTFKPDNSISRAELMTLVNNGFGLINKANIDFADVTGKEWYAKEVALAVEAGYIEGYKADNTVKPKGEITRQEMAMVISRILELAPNATGADFSDAAKTPAWSKGAIGAVAAAGYMKGYDDKSFGPTKSITRAEAVATLSRLGNYINKAGTYADLGTVSGNLIVTVPGVIVKDATINGDLIVTEGVAEGDATFENVTIKGDTKINGGGVNTVFFVNSTLAGLDVAKKINPVRVVISGTTTTGAVSLNGAATLGTSELAKEAGYGKIVISEPGNYVLNGNFDEVVIAVAGANVEIAEGAEVANLVLDAGATVSGKGKIKKATVNATGATIEQKPEEIAVAKDATVTIADKELTADDVANYNNNSGGAVGGGGGGYYIPPASSTTVKTEAELNEALTKDQYTTIYLGGSFTTKNPIAINKNNVTIDGQGKYTITIGSKYNVENNTADAIGIFGSGVTLKNLTVAQGEIAASDIEAGKPRHDNLIEIYGNNTILDNITVTNSEKAGIYVNHDGISAKNNVEKLTVTFKNITTKGNKWDGVGLLSQVESEEEKVTLTATFEGTHTFLDDVAAYVDLKNNEGVPYKGNVEVIGLKEPVFVSSTDGKQTKYTQTGIAVSTEASLLEELSGVKFKTIYLENDITTNAKVNITENDITIDGQGNTLTVGGNGEGKHTAEGLGILANDVIIKNITVLGTHGDSLIEVYGNKAVFENVTVKGSQKAGIYVNHDGVTVPDLADELTVVFKDITTEGNAWAGIGLKAAEGKKVVADFTNLVSLEEKVAVYTENTSVNEADAIYTIVGLEDQYSSEVVENKDGEYDQMHWIVKDPVITDEPQLYFDEAGRLRLDFEIAQTIDLGGEHSNIEIAYFLDDKAIKNVKEDNSSLVKNKTWSGYLVANEANLSSGKENNNNYSNVIPKNTTLSTLLQSDYTYLGSDVVENNEFKPGTYKVTITVTNHLDNKIERSSNEVTIPAPETTEE